MKKKRMALRVVAAIGVILYLIFMPNYLSVALDRDVQKEWFSREDEPYTGIITVWHVVSFKPYYGSLGATLASIAKTVEKKHYGIFFDVIAMDLKEYNERLALGESPDIYSFPAGLCYIEQLLPIYPEMPKFVGNLNHIGKSGGLNYALPYTMSGYVLLMNTAIAQERGVILPAEAEEVNAQWINDAANKMTYEYGRRKKAQMAGLAGNAVVAASLGVEHEIVAYDRFLSKDAALAIVDLRAANDIYALQGAGKGFDFEARALTNYTDLVQLCGLSRRINENKIPYAMEYIMMLLDQTNQQRFMQQGLMPVIQRTEAGTNIAEDISSEAFGGSTLAKWAYQYLINPITSNAFLYQRYKTALEESAQRALAGDEAGIDDFFERFKELVNASEME